MIPVGKITKIHGIDVECKEASDNKSSCTLCLLADKCTIALLYRELCFGNMRYDNKPVYFGKPRSI